MTDQSFASVLRRKAGAGRVVSDVTAMTPQKALRLSASRTADELMQLRLTVLNSSIEKLTLEPLVEALPDPSLILLLEGPEAALGVVALDAQTVAALIEMQTTGRVVSHTAEPRAPTRTDAAMCSGFVDGLLSEFEICLEGCPEEKWVTGYRASVRIDSGRTLSLVLDDMEYATVRVAMDFAGGSKTGEMLFAMPADGPPRPDTRRRGLAGREEWADSLNAVLMTTEARLDGILARVQVPLSTVTSWKAGDELVLERKAIANVLMEGQDGGTAARGRLGQFQGHRAVKVTGVGAMADQEEEPAGTAMEPMSAAMPALDAGLPDIGGGAEALPDLPDLPPGPAMPDIPAAGAGELPDLPAMDDLPGMEDLPPLDDLPELPMAPMDGLPDLD